MPKSAEARRRHEGTLAHMAALRLAMPTDRHCFRSNMENSKPEFTPVSREDASLWFRPLRQLFENGKPLAATTILVFGPLSGGDLPFGAISRTRNERVVFWPVLPIALPLSGDERTPLVTDHVTLELSNSKVHATSYDKEGNREHHRRRWRLQHFPHAGVALWFVLMVRRSVLEEQYNAVEWNVRVPTSDRERRLDEFRKYADQLAIQRVQTPQGGDIGKFFYCAVYVERSASAQPRLSSEILQLGPLPNGLVRGWADDRPISVQHTHVVLGDLHLLIATALPPGELSDEWFGFPQTPIDDPRMDRGPKSALSDRLRDGIV